MNQVRDVLPTIVNNWVSIKMKRVIWVTLIIHNEAMLNNWSKETTELKFSEVATQLNLGYDPRCYPFLAWLVSKLGLVDIYVAKGKIRVRLFNRICLLSYNKALLLEDYAETTRIV